MYVAWSMRGLRSETRSSPVSPRAVAVFTVMGDFVVPPGGPLPGSGGDDETLARLDALMARVTPEMRDLLEKLPLPFEHGTALDRYGARRMTRLPPERQQAYLWWWANNDQLVPAQLFMAFRSLLGLTYFERPDVLEAMHIGQPCA